MAKEKVPFSALQDYIPEGSFEKVVYYLTKYNIQLTLSKARKSILGNYKSPSFGKSHQISINGNLNKYNFLITYIHEVAHLLTFNQFQNKVEPHGKEWQNIYSNLLEEFVQLNIFPNDLLKAIRHSQKNPSASCSGEVQLTKALSNYDENKLNLVFIEQVPYGRHFITNDGRLFEKGEKRRTRHFAKEINTNRIYLFSGVYKVKLKE